MRTSVWKGSEKGCPERAIWFAGEHAAPEEEMGTVTGAYMSGERAARMVLEAIRVPRGSAE
jgi:hypothetical protein